MLQNGFLGGVLSALPNIKLSDLPTLGITNGMTPPIDGGTPPSGGGKTPPPSKFGDWAGSQDTKVIGKKLMDLGMTGADQIYYDNPDVSTRNGVINSQGDWKPAAISQILENAKRLNIRTPEAMMVNKDVLIGNPRFRDAINNPVFNNIHPNWWQIISQKILPQQWAKFDAQNKNQTTKK